MNRRLYEERLAQIKDTRQSNCAGTALFLAGLRDVDEWASPDEVMDYVSHRIRFPRKGNLIVWGKNYKWCEFSVIHAGIITLGRPIKFTERSGMEGTVIQDILLREYETMGSCERRFYEIT